MRKKKSQLKKKKENLEDVRNLSEAQSIEFNYCVKDLERAQKEIIDLEGKISKIKTADLEFKDKNSK